jgi:4-amino-4-deoxy-L-arabinose transferase-like glycosyltransferase
LGLLLVAALPRLWHLADFFTIDEVFHWTQRTERFSAALAAHDWAATNLTGHPGVTLLWLSSGGLALERAAIANGWIAPPSALEYLAWLRAPSTLLEVLAVPLAYILLRRLVSPMTALLAALLWALSPYLIMHGRLLHLDALLTTFVTFSLLLLLMATSDERRRANDESIDNKEQRAKNHSSHEFRSSAVPRFPLVASGVCAGLALLTKGPALILLPVVGLLLLGLQIAECRVPIGREHDRFRPSSFVLRLLARYALWLGVALLVVVALWPALWSDPLAALQKYTDEIVFNGGRPNGDGQFFLGHAVGDPGPLFYPVADLFRMTPAMLPGLVALPLTLVRRTTTGERRMTNDERRVMLALAFFVLFWTLVMTMGQKKFDRYVLPTWPALLILAAAGWTALLQSLRHWQVTRTIAAAGIVALLLFDSVQLAMLQPYYLSYYNPLLGGGAAAQRVLLIGWGEGMDKVGAWLRSRPDIMNGQVLSTLDVTLQPFVPVPVQDVTHLGSTPANYAVAYLESLQRGAYPQIYHQIQQTVPLTTITINGIQYAKIYQLPKPFDQPVDAQFGAALHLRGFSMARGPQQLIITPSWDVRAQPPAEYHMFLHLLDEAGQRVAQVDVPPGGGEAPPTNQWQPGQQIAVPIGLGLPANLPAGQYRLVMGLYDVATNQRVPFTGGTQADPAQAGANALLLQEITLP